MQHPHLLAGHRAGDAHAGHPEGGAAGAHPPAAEPAQGEEREEQQLGLVDGPARVEHHRGRDREQQSHEPGRAAAQGVGAARREPHRRHSEQHRGQAQRPEVAPEGQAGEGEEVVVERPVVVLRVVPVVAGDQDPLREPAVDPLVGVGGPQVEGDQTHGEGEDDEGARRGAQRPAAPRRARHLRARRVAIRHHDGDYPRGRGSQSGQGAVVSDPPRP